MHLSLRSKTWNSTLSAASIASACCNPETGRMDFVDNKHNCQNATPVLWVNNGPGITEKNTPWIEMVNNITVMPLPLNFTDLSLQVVQGEVTDHSSKATMFD